MNHELLDFRDYVSFTLIAPYSIQHLALNSHLQYLWDVFMHSLSGINSGRLDDSTGYPEL